MCMREIKEWKEIYIRRKNVVSNICLHVYYIVISSIYFSLNPRECISSLKNLGFLCGNKMRTIHCIIILDPGLHD